MDSNGNLYFNPSKELMESLKLTEVKRTLTTYERKTAKIGRNAPCGCGSGIKFKKCCYGKVTA